MVSPPLLGGGESQAARGPSDHDWVLAELSVALRPMAHTWRLLRAPACLPLPEVPEEAERVRKHLCRHWEATMPAQPEWQA
eukprot:7386756-Alexandrium_andersonii.AAC.1